MAESGPADDVEPDGLRLPKAEFFPSFEVDRTETPTDVNPMGVKGAGETGTIASTAAVERGHGRARAGRNPAPRHAAHAGTCLAGNGRSEERGRKA